MNNSERTAVLKRLTLTLKKHFSVVLPEANRNVLERLVYSICLENASFSAADEVFTALTHNFFDWNEVRVSSSRELAETMKDLPEPAQSGLRLKRILHQIFDQKYNFDLEEVRKMGMKQVTEYMEKIENITPFNVAYLMQTVLDRHSIPVSSGELEILEILGLLDNKDRESNTANWLERCVEKKAGAEFFSLLHQLAALYTKNPYSRKFQEIMVSIDPSCKARLPKRRKDSNDLEIPAASPSTSSSPAVPLKAAEPKGKTESGKPTVNSSAASEPVVPKSASKKPAIENKPLAGKLSLAKGKKPAGTVKPTEKEEILVPAVEKKAVEKKPLEKKIADKKLAAESKSTAVNSESGAEISASAKPGKKKSAEPDAKTDATLTTDSAADKGRVSSKTKKADGASPQKGANPEVSDKTGKSGDAKSDAKAQSKDKTEKAEKPEKDKTTRKSVSKDEPDSAQASSGTRRKPR